MISYSDLVGRVNAVNFQAFDQRLFAILGQISCEEHDEGGPLLSVLVVHKVGDMKPGHGFFDLAEALGRAGSNEMLTWITELAEGAPALAEMMSGSMPIELFQNLASRTASQIARSLAFYHPVEGNNCLPEALTGTYFCCELQRSDFLIYPQIQVSNAINKHLDFAAINPAMKMMIKRRMQTTRQGGEGVVSWRRFGNECRELRFIVSLGRSRPIFSSSGALLRRPGKSITGNGGVTRTESTVHP